MDDGHEALLDEQRERQRERDEKNARRIAKGARRKAAGIGGGLFATAAFEPEPEGEDEPDPAQEEYEERRRALMGHGILSRTPAPPQEGRRKRCRKYTPPPFVS